MQLYQLGLILAVLLVGLVAVIVLAIRQRRARGGAAPEPAPKPTVRERAVAAPEPARSAGARDARDAGDERMSRRIQDLARRNKLVGASFRQDVEERLTGAFDLLEQGRITLDTFKKQVRVELAEAQRRLAALEEGAHFNDMFEAGGEIEEARAALEMAEQCLAWAQDFGASPSSQATGGD